LNSLYSCVSWHLENYKKIFAEGSDEFTWLKNCGVSMTSKEKGKNVFDLQRLVGLYNPKQMLLKKIPIYDFIVKEKYVGQTAGGQGANANAEEGSSVSTAAAVEAKHKEHETGEQCGICLQHFSTGNDVERLPCNVATFKKLFNSLFYYFLSTSSTLAVSTMLIIRYNFLNVKWFYRGYTTEVGLYD
jgi:hypothetical protein